jgi:exodeoxyribonuclease VII small subunit
MEKLNYQSAYDELQAIVQAMQDNSISIDELPAALERASMLIRFCREHLRNTESQIQNLLEENS